jgi:hypothetical protein
MDDGAAKITDPAALAQVRRQALMVHVESVLATAAATLGLLALP